MLTIPTIDLSGPKDHVVSAIREACEQFGFFTIVGHGIDPQVDQGAWDAARAFFDLPIQDKLAVAMPEAGYPYGYAPFSFERLASSLGDATPPDLKETYTVGPVDPAPRPPVDPDESWARLPTLWPEALPEARLPWEHYYREMGDLCARLLQLCALALELDEHYFDPLVNAHISALRFLNYPELTQPPLPGQLRAGAHTDYGTITILRQEQRPGGLQVQGPDGTWIDVPETPGSYVVNLGDAMARWTNDRWKSTLHRVLTPPAATSAGTPTRRQSIAYFHNANWEAIIECLPSCLTDGESPKYPPIAAGPHLMQKFQSTQH